MTTDFKTILRIFIELKRRGWSDKKIVKVLRLYLF